MLNTRQAMRRRRGLLMCISCVAIAVPALLILISRNSADSGLPLTVRFLGYTNENGGLPSAVLAISNQSRRNVVYSLHDAQPIGREGFPTNLLWSGGMLVLRDLGPGETTNELIHLLPSRVASRVPVQFHFVPSWRERVTERIRMAMDTRSLKPPMQRSKGFRVFTITPWDFAFSDDLPALEANDLGEAGEVHE